ncbi:MAG: hypothetical protein KatS3mg110_4190 [Pirellulaceae bacterium]|nr:MAG: hypothetical protein KatS3mg110_4190 [Pirellulaceae bacterium]
MLASKRQMAVWLLATFGVVLEASAQYAVPAGTAPYGPGAVVDYQLPAVPPALMPAGQDPLVPVHTNPNSPPAWQNPAAPVYGAGVRTSMVPNHTEPHSVVSLYGPPPMPAPESGESASQPGKHADLVGAWCADGLCSDWFGGVYGLIMTRDNENDVWLSYDSAFPDYKLLASRHADMDWAGGFETRLGRYFNCRQNAWELVYWGLFPNVRQANACDCGLVGDLRTWIRFDNLVYDPGTGNEPVDDFFNDVERHRLLRSFQFQNVEVNLLHFVWPLQDSCWRYSTALGVRYFRFDEGLQFASDRVDEEFTGDPEEMAYTIDVVNHLVGAQIGGRVTYQPASWFNLFADAKLGLFGNHIRHRSSIGGSNGFAVVNNPGGPFDGEVIDIRSSKDDVAILGELALGGNYQLTRAISLTGGYRAVALTGVALSTNQIPLDNIWTVDSVRNVDSNGSLILHGAFAGVSINY